MSIIFDKCPRCNDYRFNPQNCRCKKFYYWIEEAEAGDNEAACTLYASYSEDAAEKAARDVSEEVSKIDVWLREGYDGEIVRFEVTPEWVLEFTAVQISGGRQ